jgi:signal peptidase I
MRRDRKTTVTSKLKVIIEWVICFGIAVVIAILINKFLIFKVSVPTGSMIPTINIEDQLFVSRIYNYNNIKRGEILVFESKEKNTTLIKRVIGLPGDTVEIKLGVVYVNGQELQEDYVKNNDDFTGEFIVPEGKYFFLGDNRRVSDDARRWKYHYIDEADVKAKAQLRVYPFSDFGFVK